MSDLISREATLKHLEKRRQDALMMDDLHSASIIMNGMALGEEAVRNQPSVQPEKRTETHACDLISRQAAIDAINQICPIDTEYDCTLLDRVDVRCVLTDLPSAQPDYQEVLGWLLAYHTKSFDLHGRYLPHEVISWLINDFTKDFIAEREQDESEKL